MKELLRSTDITLITYAKAMLDSRGIDSFLFDVNISALEGGIGAFPRRLMVVDRDFAAAVAICDDLDIEHN